MQYQGGKSRISKNISEVINALSRRKIKNIKTDCRNDFNYNPENRGGGEKPLQVYFVVVVQLKVK